jgi:hypothetical protein
MLSIITKLSFCFPNVGKKNHQNGNQTIVNRDALSCDDHPERTDLRYILIAHRIMFSVFPFEEQQGN